MLVILLRLVLAELVAVEMVVVVLLTIFQHQMELQILEEVVVVL